MPGDIARGNRSRSRGWEGGRKRRDVYSKDNGGTNQDCLFASNGRGAKRAGGGRLQGPASAERRGR